ncbi:TonB-dependent receptor [Bizionia argentinensis JUB59]|uniref:TonB-dependent receptor n=1 Tax=Bizionia argentinensis JUB59 TaxID=1046627 RepID=G2EH67_9FLAO|nr:TonB-dependent receptor plug domain-containing protein [Bizionia argentinensis]EGV42128.1 TonB-dependent receptor [Bizionia argentinensis JUB59]
MKNSSIIILLGFLSTVTVFAQQTIVKGSVTEGISFNPIPKVAVTIEGTSLTTLTDDLGLFEFISDLPLGNQILRISKNDYLFKRYPIVINEGQTVNITDMTLQKDNTADLFTINLTDDELDDDIGGMDNVSGLLQASKDVFQRTAAFEFSSSFFKVRGLGSENAMVLINGIEMNKIYDGRPQWSNWGGLNDMLRNQELTSGLTPSPYNFGGIIGATNINTRASQYRKGGRFTYSAANRSYTNRAMASYASGLIKGGWSYAVMAGRRWGDEGYQEATLYDSNSFFTSVENKLNEKHSLNFTAIYTPNRRGKSSPNTQEVYDLKGIKYNEYWGDLEGEKKNSRVKEIEEPILMLNHYWDVNSKTTLNTNIGYQFGKIGNSRLDYGGGGNPSPAYYQDLPSYFLADVKGPNYADAYLAQQNFINDGQMNWKRILDANITRSSQDQTNAYVLYEDRADDKQLTANAIFSTEINERIILNAAINYRSLKSENFGNIIDLLGGTGVLNVDSFDGFQYDSQNPDRVIVEGDKFRYNYNMFANIISGYAQAQFNYSKFNFYLSGSFASTSYQREGLWEHDYFAGDLSYGKSEKLNFTGFGGKGGFTYKITGKHILDINAGYIAKAPSIRNSFSNSRDNNSVVENILVEKITSIDVSYIFRSSNVKAKLTGYYSKIADANEISFYYADGITNIGEEFNDTSAFVQEISQGVDKKQIGAELGIEAQVIPTIKLKGVAAVGQFTYDNNPDLYLTSSSFNRSPTYTANLKGYKVAGGPQQAYSFGFEYRDPDYWWFGATVNYFSNTYVDVSPLLRTENFYLANDGLPINNYDQEVASELLKQEEFDAYFTVNLTGGKSWKIGNYYIGVFVSINNLLDELYKTGGFEQGRNANYTELLSDNRTPKRKFGPKYWYGRGASYFVNLNFRF